MLTMLTKVKLDQAAMKINLNAFKTEISNLAEIVNKTKENVKKPIEIDESFVMPSFPCKSILAARMLNADCAGITYCDQVVIIFLCLVLKLNYLKTDKKFFMGMTIAFDKNSIYFRVHANKLIKDQKRFLV